MHGSLLAFSKNKKKIKLENSCNTIPKLFNQKYNNVIDSVNIRYTEYDTAQHFFQISYSSWNSSVKEANFRYNRSMEQATLNLI